MFQLQVVVISPENSQPMSNQAKFANVQRELVLQQPFDGTRFYLPRFDRRLLQEVSEQRRDVFQPLAEGRHSNYEAGKPSVEIPA